MASASSLVFFIFNYFLILSFAEQVTEFNPKCPPLPCGSLGNISFPFSTRTHPECGLLVVDNCHQPFFERIQLGKDGPSFYVTAIKQDNTLILRENQSLEISKNHCASFKNLSLSSTSVYSFEHPYPSTMLNCSNYNIPTNLKLVCNESNHSLFHYNHTTNDLQRPPAGCSVIQAVVNKTSKYVVINNMHTGWFSLQVNVMPECLKCSRRGGQCLSDSNANFNCSGARKGIKVTIGGRICTWSMVNKIDDLLSVFLAF